MAQNAGEYSRGDMDVQAHLATYHTFGRLYKWGSLVIGVMLLFLSMWLCAHVGFIASAAVAAIILGLGVFWLTRKKVDDVDIELSGR